MKYHFLFLILIITAYNSTAQTKKIKQCVIEKGTLKMVDTEYDPSTGIYYVSVSGTRYRFDEAYPSGIDYAAAASWYINNEPITVNGQAYIKYGLPRILAINEIEKTSSFQTIGVYTERGTKGVAEVIYIPVKPGCEFQPYQKEVKPCALKLDITTSTASITPGKNITFSVTATGTKQKMVYEWLLMEDDEIEKDANHRIKGSSSGKSIIVSTKGLKKELAATVLVSLEDNSCYGIDITKVVKVK